MILVENLIHVCVEHDVVNTGGRVHEAIPIAEALESVMNDHRGVGIVVTDSAPSIIVELLEHTKVKRRPKWFIENGNGSHDVGVWSIALCESTNSVNGLRDSIARLPLNGAIATAVVEAILRARSCDDVNMLKKYAGEVTYHRVGLQ